MTIENGMGCQFYFNSPAQFDLKVAETQLSPGSLYFVNPYIHLALTENTYQSFGGGASDLSELEQRIAELEQAMAGTSEYLRQTRELIGERIDSSNAQ